MIETPPDRWGVSVIVPVWNEARRLPRLLDALETCEPGPLEIVVADGGSDDGSVDLARGRARVIEAERGRASQLQAGAEAARGEILWFLHADTLPPRHAVRELGEATEAGAAGGCFRIEFPAEERDRHPLLHVVERGIEARTRITRSGTGDQGIFVRRAVFRRVGGYPPWPLFEDVALSAAIRRAGRFAVCPGPLVTSGRRFIRGGVARTMLRMWSLRIGYALGVSPSTLARRWRAAPE